MKKIVIMEDNEDIAFSLIERLESEGYHTVLLSNGWEALCRVLKREKAPDAVILDLMLAGGTGRELAGSVRSVWPRTKIWVFSADPQGFFLKNAGMENLIQELKHSI